MTYTVTHVLNFGLSLHRLLRLSNRVPKLSFLSGTVCSVLAAAAIVVFFVPTVPRWSNVLICSGLYLTLLALLLMLTGTVDRSAKSA